MEYSKEMRLVLIKSNIVEAKIPIWPITFSGFAKGKVCKYMENPKMCIKSELPKVL